MEEKKEVTLSLLFGLSILIDYLTIFSNKKEVIFKINFDKQLIKNLRGEYDDIYFDSLNAFLKENIKTLNNVILCDNPSSAYISPEELINMLKINENSLIPYEIKDQGNINFINDFIIINTKVITGRDIGIKEKWDKQVKQKLFDIIKKSKYKIVLIGEKKYSDCYEYRLHKTFNIYDDIIKSDMSKILDLTVDDTIKLYDKNIIIRNLNLLKKSKFNIHIGEGGGIKIYSHFNDLIAFTGVPIILHKYLNSNFKVESSFEPEDFLNTISNYLLNQNNY